MPQILTHQNALPPEQKVLEVLNTRIISVKFLGSPMKFEPTGYAAGNCRHDCHILHLHCGENPSYDLIQFVPNQSSMPEQLVTLRTSLSHTHTQTRTLASKHTHTHTHTHLIEVTEDRAEEASSHQGVVEDAPLTFVLG